jgi:hypothetical protein
VSNPINTTGLSGGDVSTTHKSGQTTRDWVDDHNTAVEGTSPDGDTLKTTWTSAAGAESVTTTRMLDEDDEHFLARHEIDYLTGMVGAPPVP